MREKRKYVLGIYHHHRTVYMPYAVLCPHAIFIHIISWTVTHAETKRDKRKKKRETTKKRKAPSRIITNNYT
jgi:hypothetical protein